jgi:hypothetical protein
MDGIWTIVGVSLLSGAAGGLANHVLESMDTQIEPQLAARRPLWKYVLVGVVAAFAVPLFLSLAQSTLLREMLAKGLSDPGFFPSLFIYSGFCIVAAFSSRAFLTSLSERVTQQLQENRRSSEDASNKADIAVELAEEAAESKPVDRTIMMPDTTAASTADGPAFQLSDKELQALKAMMSVTFRTQTGIAREIGLPRNQVGEVVDALASKALVERTTSPHTGGPRWRITPLGVTALNARP